MRPVCTLLLILPLQIRSLGIAYQQTMPFQMTANSLADLHNEPGQVGGCWRLRDRFRRDLSVGARYSVLVFLLSAATVHAVQDDDSDWGFVKSKAGVEIKQRDVANSRFKATRGTLLSDAHLFDALAVLRDVAACKDWLHKCKHGEIVSEVSAGQTVYYTVIDSPFVFKDRDTYVQSTIVYDAQTKAIHIDMLGVEDTAPAHKKRVRVLGFTGSWHIEQHGPNQIKLTYEVHMDPQASSAAAANAALATSVLETLINIDRLAKMAPYRNSVISPDRLQAITRTPANEQ